MTQLLTSCYFSMLSGWTRLSSIKVVLYALVIALVLFAIFQHGLHEAASTHVHNLLADNDPWNG